MALSGFGTYVFEVSLKATKPQIRRAIEGGFGVEVARVRTLVGRTRWVKKRARMGPPRYWKKAYVKLKEGQKISLLDGAQ